MPHPNPDNKPSLHTTGTVLRGLKRYEEALDNFRQALEAYRSVFGTARSQAGCLLDIGNTLDNLRRYAEAAINAVLACDVVFDMVTDTRSDIERFDWANPDAGSEHLTDYPDDYPNQAPSQNARPATQQERRLVQAAMAAALDTAPPDWFARKLHVVLDGVEHALAP